MKITEDEKSELLKLIFGFCGQILDGNKRQKDIIYNANIIIDNKKYWYGDFRLYQKYKLQDLAKLLNCGVYLLREMDARFETESNPNLSKAVVAYDKKGQEINGKS